MDRACCCRLLVPPGCSSYGGAGLPTGARGVLIILGISCHFLLKISLAKCNVPPYFVELNIGNGVALGEL